MLKEKKHPAQKQNRQPGIQSKMKPLPETIKKQPVKGKLHKKTAIITGGDSGIGRAIAVLFAKEGADVFIIYLNEHKDAKEAQLEVEQEGVRCIIHPCDVGDEAACKKAVDKAKKEFGRIDILINNAAEQHPQNKIEDITTKQLEKTFKTNVFSMFHMTKHVLKHLKKGSCIINTASITAYKGNDHLLDYASTKGAIVAFTRSLSQNIIDKGIRVNAVAPGPIWTPLIPATFSKEKVKKFGTNVPMKRAGEPSEVAPCFLFLASDEASYMTGQVLHPNGGEIING